MATRMATTINGLQPVCECSVCRIVGGIDPDLSLDAAWAEAEAALPEGYWMRLATQPPPQPSYIAGSVDDESLDAIWCDGPTPAAALRALASKLRERER